MKMKNKKQIHKEAQANYIEAIAIRPDRQLQPKQRPLVVGVQEWEDAIRAKEVCFQEMGKNWFRIRIQM
jgi:hypothetical protein